jgi:hypothetical protein
MYVTGALVVTFSTLAMAEAVRSLRFLLMPAGIWLLVFGPWTVQGETAGLKILQVLLGAGLLALSYRRGRIRERYADWQCFLF